jgi:hypothetical protein
MALVGQTWGVCIETRFELKITSPTLMLGPVATLVAEGMEKS